MRRRKLTTPVQLITTGFTWRRKPNWAVVLSILAISLVQTALVVLGSYMDNTWTMPHGARGLAVHYGAWATLLTDPLLLIAAAFAYRQFQLAMATLPVRGDARKRGLISRMVRPHLEFVNLRRRGSFVYALLVLVGALSWLNNLRQTSDPVTYFGHDVYDSTAHIYGFLAHKFMLFVSWIIVYPAVGFVIVSLCVSTRIVLEKAKNRKLILPNVTHPDGCYGLAELGLLNVSLLVPFFLAFSVIFAVIITHDRTYASAEIPLALLTVLFLSVSVITIKPLLVQARAARHFFYAKLSRQSSRFGIALNNSDLIFGIERVCFGMASGSPYSRTSKMLLLGMRITPIVLTAFKFYDNHFR